MANRLSFSKISSYSTCGTMYKHRYVDKLQEKYLRASLCFGSALDEALNSLLVDRDLDKAKAAFQKKWAFQYVRGTYTSLCDHPDFVYSERDLDLDLIPVTEEEVEWIKEFKEHKKVNKWDHIDEEKRKRYNHYCWRSLEQKGLIILESYHAKVLPQFVKVEGVQHMSEMTNEEGDTVVQYLDFVAHLSDGSVVLMDNKSTSDLKYYEDDSPGTSQQLISYYYNNKEKFGLTAVGFVAMQKNLIKNKTKVCSKCGLDGTESRAKSCDKEVFAIVTKRGKEVEEKVRCGGEWQVTLKPEALIKVIVNPVTDAAVDLVLSAFDEANQGIKQGNYYRNLSICKNIYGSPCPYYKLCWQGKDDDLIKVEDKKSE